MVHRRTLPLLTLTALLLIPALAAAADWKVHLISAAEQPDLARDRLARAYAGHPGGPVSEAVNVALDDVGVELDAAGTALKLSQDAAADLNAARAAAQRAEKAGAVAVLADVPTAWLLAIADAVKLPVLNLSDTSDRLRQQDCRANLLHLPPSERMRADALAQALVQRKWGSVLLLTGPSARDAERSAVAQAALRRYGVKLVANKPYKLSTDPRERDLANPLLLTGGGLSYDAVWVVDSDGEFARSLPYRTALPRPVVGDGGLMALAWQAQFERFGAPQVSRRFAKATQRPMGDLDWAAWMGIKALAEAAVAVPKGTPAAFAKALQSASVDGTKGVALAFRPWDGQLRQPLLLTDGVGVIGSAPIDGLLHPRNVLDTLGADAPEKLCKARS
jgi:ABC transporter substrate binding protein (PQQ-dependent alcohol dehydrogenase system)